VESGKFGHVSMNFDVKYVLNVAYTYEYSDFN